MALDHLTHPPTGPVKKRSGEGMTTMYQLQHIIRRALDDQDVKAIGLYTSEALLKRVIERKRSEPGFSDPRGQFFYDAYSLDEDFWPRKPERIWIGNA